MASLKEIPGIGKASLALLEAAGYGDPAVLATAVESEVATALAAANKKLRLAKRPPSKVNIQKWIAAARALAPVEPELETSPAEISEPESETPPASNSDSLPQSQVLVNYEEREEVLELLAEAPFAVPLPSRVLVSNRLGVSDIPPAPLLNAYPGDLDLRVERKVAASPVQTAPKSFYPNAGGRSSLSGPKLDLDISRLRPLKEMEGATPRMPATTGNGNDRVSLLRAPLEETNRGKDPNSRRFIRGVLHSHPLAIWWGAVITLTLVVITPLAIVSSALLLLSREMPEKFSWSPPWLLALPAAFPLVGIAWLLWGISAKCRICGIKLFVHRHHRKNAKAHHLPLLGYVIPLCLHILFFRWFRCTHCGTPVRLKS